MSQALLLIAARNGKKRHRIAQALTTLALLLAATRPAAASEPVPIIDNERVLVWKTADIAERASNDFVAVSLTHGASARFGLKGTAPGRRGSQDVVIELKDFSAPSVANNSGYPTAFPRPHAHKLLENARVIVWRYRWYPGQPTPMHIHDKDVVVVYLEDMALQSTTPDGNSILNEYKPGDVRFNARGRIHSELLARGSGSAVITELK